MSDRRAKQALRKVLRYARRLSADVLFDIVALWFCWLDPKTPRWAKIIAAAALAYFVIPTDVLPDPIFGDDAGVVAAALVKLRDVMLDRHRDEARRWIAAKIGLRRERG
jgi:uncharacterized membrane protein YkvA (DUF1232 family)